MPTINQLPSIDEVSGGNQIPTYYSGGGDARKMSVNLLQDYLQDNLDFPDNASEITYNPAGTSAVERTVQSKLRDVVNVLDFGAVGDGVTDDTAAIQAAINYVQNNMTLNVSNGPYTGPQTLYFPDGYFKTTAPLLITKAISIVGSKSSEFSTGARLFSTTSGDLLRFTPAGGGISFSVERMNLFSTVAGTGHLINVVDGSPGYNSWRVKDCCFQNPQQMAIRATGDDIQILNNTFDVSGYSGNCIQLGSNTAGDVASNVRIIGNNFFNITVHCILIYNAQGAVISNNIVSQPNSSTSSVAFVDAQDSSAALCYGINIVGNEIYKARRIFAASAAVNCNFVGNLAFDCGIGGPETYNALEFSNTCSNITISGNSINGSYGTKSIFNNIGTLTNINLVGNAFSGSGSGTAIVAGGMSGNVSGNIISGWTTPISATDYYAIGYVKLGVQVPTYGASINIDATAGDYVLVLVTDNSAFTINAPTNPSNGQQITVQIYNNFGGALGAATWNAIFKLSTWTQPASGSSRLITFRYSSGLVKWTEVSRTTTDIPN
jgi:hypothetical protein